MAINAKIPSTLDWIKGLQAEVREKPFTTIENAQAENFLSEVWCPEIIKALEKQNPIKPNEYEDKYYACPRCYNVLLHKWEKYPTVKMPLSNGLPYCLGCGQAIDWSEEE